MKKFNVIIEDNGQFKQYDIIPYLVERYKKEKNKPKTKKEFKEFVDNWSKYQWWARCEYEIILMDWPGQSKAEKWDVYRQVLMNLDIITDIVMESVL